MPDPYALLREAEARAKLLAARERQEIALQGDLFDLQVDFIEDPAKRKTLVCGRRAGKTHVLKRYLVRTAMRHAGSLCLYVALTRPYAVSLLWRELTAYLAELGLGVKLDNNLHTIDFPNGSRIVFGGVSSKDEREKLRGFAYHLVVADEVGSFGPYLSYLLEDVLQAALLDYDGTLVLAGTPGPTAAGAFYDADHDRSGAWKHWHWTVLQNPKIPQWKDNPKWQAVAGAFLGSVRLKTPDAKFRREYLGEWVRDVDALLYALDATRNYYDFVPAHGYDYVIGADTGYNDASAIVVVGASRITRHVYLVSEWSASGVLIDRLAHELKATQARYPDAQMVIDPANKQLVESMKQIYNLPLQAADKAGKRAHIDIMNASLHQGALLFPRGSQTYEQMSILEWNKTRTAESEAFPADLADSLLYAYTHIYNWHNAQREPEPLTERQRHSEEERLLIETAVRRAQGKSDDPLDFDEPDWGDL